MQDSAAPRPSERPKGLAAKPSVRVTVASDDDDLGQLPLQAGFWSHRMHWCSGAGLHMLLESHESQQTHLSANWMHGMCMHDMNSTRGLLQHAC
jgi:hypothetical protein